MHLVARLVDRTLALSLAFAPLGQLLAGSSLGTSGAVLAGGVLSLVVAALLVLYGPDHEGGDAWRFGGYTFVGFVAVSILARAGRLLTLADSPLLGTLAWVVVACGAFWLVERRRSSTAA